MSALNDSRSACGRPLPGGRQHAPRLQGTPSSIYGDDAESSKGGGGMCELEAVIEHPHSFRSEEEDTVEAHSSPEQLLSLVQRDVRRHECQIASLLSEKHQHCEHLANVYEELEKMLHKMHLVSPQVLKGHVAPLPTPTFGAPNGEEDGCAASINAPALASSLQQRFHQVLQQHQDRVYDVLVDYRQQIDKHEYETGRRLRAIEDVIAQIQSDVRELQHTSRSQIEELRHAQQHVRQRLEAVVAQQEAQRVTLDATSEAQSSKVALLISKIQEDVTRLRADAKAARTQQIQSVKELEGQIRSLSSAQRKTEEALEVQGASIARLHNQDSLEGAFHEVKDWLGDLEKRMVSRGELLQWTESLQSEIHQMRRVSGASVAHKNESSALGHDA
ncbi:hypothetical protein GH5_00549 [Leishmania sp. Ghana 2012 LV757]|uniref:hypothetical protein n=1 Tax=Leishmania sp. Ghana 2012 LV757 TaxID=2803181 RepID=UPI001B5B03C7|nr:hypothetical protein GH5_00549 [Leishmania sp. Ghana 2012 LV757]